MHNRKITASLCILLAIAGFTDFLTACTPAAGPTVGSPGQPGTAASPVPETATVSPAPTMTQVPVTPTATRVASPSPVPTLTVMASPSPTTTAAWPPLAGILTGVKQETVSRDTIDKITPDDGLLELVLPEPEDNPMMWNCSKYSDEYPTPVLETWEMPELYRQMDALLLTFCGWKKDEQVKVSMHYPDGRENAKTFTAAKSSGKSYYVQFGYQINLGDPLGGYTVIAEGASGRVEKKFKVAQASFTSPRVLAFYPDPFLRSYRVSERPAGPKWALLSGFSAGETVRLLVYSRNPVPGEDFWLLGVQQVVTGPDGNLVVKSEIADPVYWIAIRETSVTVPEPFYGEHGVLMFPPKLTAQCPVLRPDRLAGLSRFQVAFTDGSDLRVRRQPGFAQKIAATLPEGTELEPGGNPACADKTWWWPVTVEDVKGWVAEASPEEYLLEPMP